MVSFRNVGRLGNTHFMAAASWAYAKSYGLEWSMPNWTTDGFWCALYLQHLVHPNYERREDILINENGMQFQEIPFQEQWRDLNIVLNGFFQSEKYFAEYKEDIWELFNYPYEFKEGYVSCHVRRGDYLTLPQKHPEVTKEWYEKAMGLFEGYKFRFFSDDINWCKNNFGNRSDCEFSENKTIEQDLYEASWCAHNICSASTYSWWQMYLNQNKNKIVIFPKLWFQETWHDNSKDVLPEWVIKL